MTQAVCSRAVLCDCRLVMLTMLLPRLHLSSAQVSVTDDAHLGPVVP
jgi:hypothetical protein